jgi:hypothetical protein
MTISSKLRLFLYGHQLNDSVKLLEPWQCSLGH